MLETYIWLSFQSKYLDHVNKDELFQCEESQLLSDEQVSPVTNPSTNGRRRKLSSLKIWLEGGRFMYA